jgi:hypothetical protein
MECRKCKLDNLSGSTFCEGCGASLTETPSDEAEHEEELSQKIDEMKDHIKEKLTLNPEDIKAHLDQVRRNLKLGKGSIKTRLSRLGKDLKLENVEDLMKGQEKPLKNMVISFIAWAILRFTTPFHRRIVTFLMSPLGLLVLLIVAFAYGTFEKEIAARVEEMKRGGQL